jgi:hypothetical protein
MCCGSSQLLPGFLMLNSMHCHAAVSGIQLKLGQSPMSVSAGAVNAASCTPMSCTYRVPSFLLMNAGGGRGHAHDHNTQVEGF